MIAMSDISLQSNCIIKIFIAEVTSPYNLRCYPHYSPVTLAVIILLYRSLENLNGIFMLFVIDFTDYTQCSSGGKTNIKCILAPSSIIISNAIKVECFRNTILILGALWISKAMHYAHSHFRIIGYLASTHIKRASTAKL
jgi:hypothetical protein